MNNNSALHIPLGKIDGSIHFFADEIPVECEDIIDALRSELAPFRVWKNCAVICIVFSFFFCPRSNSNATVLLRNLALFQVEYFKQGNAEAFETILNDIVQSLKISGMCMKSLKFIGFYHHS